MTKAFLLAAAAVITPTLAQNNAPVITAPVPIETRPVDAGRALAEFEAICLAPIFDEARTQKAVSASSFRYVAEPPFDGHGIHQRRWNSPEATATLTLPAAPEYLGPGIPQCEVNMAGSEPHTAQQLIDMVRPLIKARFLGAIEQAGETPTLRWQSKDSRISYDLSFGANGEPTRSLDFVLSTFTPEGRAFIENLLKGRKK